MPIPKQRLNRVGIAAWPDDAGSQQEPLLDVLLAGMTSDSSQGATVTASSYYNPDWFGWVAHNRKTDSPAGWATAANKYDASGLPITDPSWNEIDLGYVAINVCAFSFTAHALAAQYTNQSPRKGRIEARASTSDPYAIVATFDIGATPPALAQEFFFKFSAPGNYRYLRFIVESTFGNLPGFYPASTAAVNQIRYFKKSPNDTGLGLNTAPALWRTDAVPLGQINTLLEEPVTITDANTGYLNALQVQKQTIVIYNNTGTSGSNLLYLPNLWNLGQNKIAKVTVIITDNYTGIATDTVYIYTADNTIRGVINNWDGTSQAIYNNQINILAKSGKLEFTGDSNTGNWFVSGNLG